ncbi:unnamed protein product [Effrenium voratum]|uniref:Uncharacterized protein n=1 Tax=Effrenium voratum TaxID=2562239 RepID=A0AA36HK85_9DINO|nr:unnamed protein product [Effrenium voratum]
MVKKSKGALAKAKLKPEAEDDEEEEEEEEAMASEGEDMSDEEAEGEEEEDEEDDEEEGNLKVFVGNIRWSKAGQSSGRSSKPAARSQASRRRRSWPSSPSRAARLWRRP